MKKFILFFILVVPVIMQAQDAGLHFYYYTWKEIKAKAKAENKYIFMDCFATWCGPCRYMSETIFPSPEVGEFMNDKFVSVKVQLDVTAIDDPFVRAWYANAHDIAVKYNIQAYPTYLVFDADANIVHRFVGAASAEEFIKNASNSLNPQTQYYTLLNQYKKNKKDTAILRNLAMASANAYDMNTASKLFNEYLATQSDLYTKNTLDLIKTLTKTSDDKGFNIVLSNPEKVDAVCGKGMAASILQPIIMREEIFKKFPANVKAKPDWDKINKGVAKKYSVEAPELMAKAKVIWYQHAEDWNNFQTAVLNYMHTYGDNASPGQLNDYAWAIFVNCPDMNCVAEALEWSKRSVDTEMNPAFMDTYANILYKLGKKEDALVWEQKAMDLASGSNKTGYQEKVDKMKNNEKTWKD